MGLLSYYIRVFIRSHFKPINKEIAKRWNANTSIMYFLLAWSAFGYSVYAYLNTHEENEKDPHYRGAMVTDPYQLMKKFGTKPEFTLITMSGTTVEKEVFTLDEVNKKVAELNGENVSV